MVIMRMETDLSTPKCSQRQEFILKCWKHIPPSGSQRPGEESHTPREQPSFANHQINKFQILLLITAGQETARFFLLPIQLGILEDKSGSRELRGMGESMAANKNQYFACYQENKVCNSGNKHLASYPAEALTLNNIINMQTVTAGWGSWNICLLWTCADILETF